MDASLLQPLFVDCSVEYQLDMARFPGWDDPQTRAQPTLMLHLPEHESCLCYSACRSVEDELQTVLREFSTTEDELQSIVQDLCSYLESTGDELPSFVDDVLMTLTGATSTTDSDHAQSPHTVPSVTQTSDDVMTDGQTWEDFLCDSDISGQMSPSFLFSPDSSSSSSASSAFDCDIDFLLHLSPNDEPHHSCRKRKISGDPDNRPSAKRQCNHGDDLLSGLYSTFITASDLRPAENEMAYGFSVCVRD